MSINFIYFILFDKLHLILPYLILNKKNFRYIEGLSSENKYISNWDKQMSATSENTQIPDTTKLPADWLGNGVGNHGNVVNALWTLRNMMMRDVLAINKTL